MGKVHWADINDVSTPSNDRIICTTEIHCLNFFFARDFETYYERKLTVFLGNDFHSRKNEIARNNDLCKAAWFVPKSQRKKKQATATTTEEVCANATSSDHLSLISPLVISLTKQMCNSFPWLSLWCEKVDTFGIGTSRNTRQKIWKKREYYKNLLPTKKKL